MIQNKPIIWQMSKDYKPEKEIVVFETVFDKEFPTHNYICGFDPYLPEEPLNFWNKIKKKLGLKYKVKERNSYIAVGKIETVNGKQVISYETNR